MVMNEFKLESRMAGKELVVENPTVGNMGVGQLVLAGVSYTYREGPHPNMSPRKDTTYKNYDKYYFGKIVFAELKLQIGSREEKPIKEKLEEIRKIAEGDWKKPVPVDKRPYELILNPAIKIERSHHNVYFGFEKGVLLKTEDIWSPSLELLIALCQADPEGMKNNFDLELDSKPLLKYHGHEYEPMKD
jgi:hypothetical protein